MYDFQHSMHHLPLLVSNCLGYILLSGHSSELQDPSPRWQVKALHQWDICESCNNKVLEAQNFRSVVCIGPPSDVQWNEKYSEKGTQNIPCNACRKCPTCESCYQTLSLHQVKPGSHMGLRPKIMLDLTDSIQRKYLAIVAKPSNSRHVLAIRHITQRCGLDDIIPIEKYGPLHARIKLGNELQELDASSVVFSEMRKGQWLPLPGRPLHLNGTQMFLARVFDFLIAAGDRQPGNILYQKQTNSILLIDSNGGSFGSTPRSIFIPGTPKYYFWWKTYSRYIDLALLDFNMSLPLQVQECLHDIVAGKIDEPSHLSARALWFLKRRASALLGGVASAIVEHHCKHYSTNSTAYRRFESSNNGNDIVKMWTAFNSQCLYPAPPSSFDKSV